MRGAILRVKQNSGSEQLRAQMHGISRGMVVVYLHHHLLWTELCVPKCLVLTLRTSSWDSIWR